MVIQLAAIIVISYLLGSFPTAVVISKLFFGFDIRTKGSGNMGSTNAIRVLGWKWGVVVQIIDILKGFLAVIVVANLIGADISFNNFTTYFEDITIVRLIAGISAVAGHIFSCFVQFKGGKGINTAAGMLLGIAPIDVGISLGIFLIALICSGYVSLGSIFAAIALPSSVFVRYNVFNVSIPGYHFIILFFVGLSTLLIFAHRKNILRLAHGTENKFRKLQLIKINIHKKHQ